MRGIPPEFAPTRGTALCLGEIIVAVEMALSPLNAGRAHDAAICLALLLNHLRSDAEDAIGASKRATAPVRLRRLLLHADDATTAEVARRLGCPVAWVKQIARGHMPLARETTAELLRFLENWS